MAINLVTKTKTKIKSLKTSDGENIVEVYRSPSTADWLPANTRILTANSFIKNFRLYCQLNETFPAIVLPDIALTDTKMQQVTKTVDAYWKGARKQLNIYLAESGTNWVLIGQVSLVRMAGYPYQLIALMDTLTENIAVELGMDSAIGVSVTNVTYGGIANGDILNFIASVVEEYSITTVYTPVTYQTLNTIIGTTPIKVLPANLNRRSFRITNQSNSMAFLSLSENTNPVFGIQLQPNGDFYHHSEMESQYTGSVWAQSWAANSNLLIMEGV
jgi:hypothetical protein